MAPARRPKLESRPLPVKTLLRRVVVASFLAIAAVLALQPLFVGALVVTRQHADLPAIRAHITQAFADGVLSSSAESELRSSPAHAVARKRVPTESTAARERLMDMSFLLCPVTLVVTRVRMRPLPGRTWAKRLTERRRCRCLRQP